MTTITISKTTRHRLAEIGRKDNTFDEIVVKILDKLERKAQ